MIKNTMFGQATRLQLPQKVNLHMSKKFSSRGFFVYYAEPPMTPENISKAAWPSGSNS